MKPTWATTFNGKLKYWGHLSYARKYAIAGGYKFFLWTDDHIYEASYAGYCTKWTIADLYQ